MADNAWMTRQAARFDEAYFERGKAAGVSWYENFRWMPERSYQEAEAFIWMMGVSRNMQIVDFGCAKGFFVRAMEEKGYNAWGIDISRYALESCDTKVAGRLLRPDENSLTYDVGFVKDTLEHVAYEDIDEVLAYMKSICLRWLIIVPLAERGMYLCKEYECDATHVIREPVQWWLNKLAQYWDIPYFSSRVNGLKDKWAEVHPLGNLFVVTA
jgi:SAM-dependent methyltransferase